MSWHSPSSPASSRGNATAAASAAPGPVGVLAGTEDAYDGFIVGDELPGTSEEFAAALDASLPAWQQKGYRGIWLKVPTSRAHFFGLAVDRGFEPHHAGAMGQRAAGQDWL